MVLIGAFYEHNELQRLINYNTELEQFMVNVVKPRPNLLSFEVIVSNIVNDHIREKLVFLYQKGFNFKFSEKNDENFFKNYKIKPENYEKINKLYVEIFKEN